MIGPYSGDIFVNIGFCPFMSTKKEQYIEYKDFSNANRAADSYKTIPNIFNNQYC